MGRLRRESVRQPGARWRLFLYNTSTGERTLLDETTNRCGCLFPGTIAYPWVTWAVGEDASAWRYDIRTGEQVPLLPTDRDEYAVTVPPTAPRTSRREEIGAGRAQPSTGSTSTATRPCCTRSATAESLRT